MTLISGALHDDAIRCLLELPTALSQRDFRQRLVDELRQHYPSMGIDLVTVPRPDGHYADFSLVLRYPDGVVAKLSALHDQGDPWQVSTAEPWAADTLLTVDGESLSIHSCILYIDDYLSGGRSSLALEIENRLLLQNELKQLAPSVAQLDVDRAERIFRRHHGLLPRSAMLHWLEEKGLGYRDFRDLMALNLRLDQCRRAICAQHRPEWQAEHPELIRVMLLCCNLPSCSEEEALEWLAEIAIQSSADDSGLSFRKGINLTLSPRWLDGSSISLEVKSDWLMHLDEQWESAVAPTQDWFRQEVCGDGQQRWCRVIHQVSVQATDSAWAEQVDELVFEEWLRTKRALAKVRWHWS